MDSEVGPKDSWLTGGWTVIGVDIADFSATYPGQFIQADVPTWEGWRDLRLDLVVASPPCEEFSRWSMPWTRAKHPPQPRLDLWRRAELIAKESRAPPIIENVRGAEAFMGKAKSHCGPFYLWGDVPCLLPPYSGKPKESWSSTQRPQRARIYKPLAQYIASCF